MAQARTKSLKANREATKATRVASARLAPNTSTMGAAALVPVDKPMTEMQKDFGRAIAMGDSVPNAMAKAGYTETPSYGYRMMKMPNVLAFIKAEQEKNEEASQMTRKRVIDMHLEAYDAAKLLSEPSSMVAAAREIGKMCGYYEPKKVDVNVSVNGQIAIQQMGTLSDAQLMQMVEAGAREQLEHIGDEEDESSDPPALPR